MRTFSCHPVLYVLCSLSTINKLGQCVAQVFFIRTNLDAWGFSVRTQNVQNCDKIARNDFTFSLRSNHLWLFFNLIFHFIFSMVAAYLSQNSAKTKINSIKNKIEQKRRPIFIFNYKNSLFPLHQILMWM